MANHNPRPSNAAGIEVESTSPPSVSENSNNRTGVFSGSSQLVIQEVETQTHQTARNSSVACNIASGVKWPSSVCDICVTAKTKTRSKNSSAYVTRLCWFGTV